MQKVQTANKITSKQHEKFDIDKDIYFGNTGKKK